jgi:hypothetical protein
MPPTQHMYRYLVEGIDTETHWGLEFIYKFWQFRAILQTRSFDLFKKYHMYLQNPKPVWNHGYSPYRGGTMNLSLCLRPKF